MMITKKRLIFLLLALGLAVFVLWLPVFNSRSVKTNIPAPTPRAMPKDFNADYSSLNKLTPGKSNEEDVVQINGVPLYKSTLGSKTYLYYPTPDDFFKNIVMLENGVVSYALENVFGSYRGSYDYYIREYGKPTTTFYSKDINGVIWIIYFDKGIGMETTIGKITKVLYFVPQSEESFMENVAGDVGITKSPPIPNEPVIMPAP